MIADDDTFLLLNAYRDGELSPSEALAMERRLAAEPDLRRMADALGALSRDVRDVLAVAPPPQSLRARVVQQVGFRRGVTRRSWLQSWQPMAAMLAVGLLGGGVIGSGAEIWLSSTGTREAEDAVLDGHLRALTAPEPFDVASSNRHVVKPWFNGRTTVAPDVVDLAEQGFPLAGGRIDVVAGKTVPTLVYRRDRHVISVTVVPGSDASVAGEDHRDGYTVRHWQAKGLTYWLVTDLDAAGIDAFVRLFRGNVPNAD